MGKRVTVEVIKQRLIDENRPITLLNYAGKITDRSTLWKCHDCDYEWNATADSVLRGNGCRSCAGSLPLTSEVITQRLINDKRTISLLSYGKNTNDKTTLWKCHDCSHEWNTSTSSVLGGSGCPVCAGSLPLTSEVITQRLINDKRPVTLLNYGKNANDPSSLWKCHDCDHEWNTNANGVLRGSGCRSCAGTLPLTFEIITQRLIDSNRAITLLSYSGKAIDNSSLWKCHDCNYEWTASASNILNNGNGCPVCAGKLPLTFEIITQRLIDSNRAITLLSYGGKSSDCSSLWKCHDCNYEWNAKVSNIFTGTGCPQCAGTLPLTFEIITQRLINDDRPISLLSYGKNSNDPSSLWRCHDCDYEWNAQSTRVLCGGGCPSCYGNLPLAFKEITQKLIDDNRSISILSYGKNANDRSSEWMCHDCSRRWNATAGSVLSGNGCSACSGKLPLTFKMVEQRLIDDKRPITLLKLGKNSKDNSSLWRCHDCGNEWNAHATRVLCNCGCPSCAEYGFDPGKPGYVYLHTFIGSDGTVFIKIGKTNKVEQRHGQLDNQTIDGITYTIESTMDWYFEIGGDAADLESTILDMSKFEKHAYNGLQGTSFDGRTELFENAVHQEILDYIAENYETYWV